MAAGDLQACFLRERREPPSIEFLIASQVMELLFALLRHEWTIAGEKKRQGVAASTP